MTLPPAPGGRTYRRTAGTRFVSTACALLFSAVAISAGLASGLTPGVFVLSGLALLGAAGALGAWGDFYVLGADGIEHRNAVLSLFGVRPRRVRWEDVVQVREHRALRFGRLEANPSAVFLVLRSGRRLALDSLQDFDEALRTIRRHAGTSGVSTPPACPPR